MLRSDYVTKVTESLPFSSMSNSVTIPKLPILYPLQPRFNWISAARRTQTSYTSAFAPLIQQQKGQMSTTRKRRRQAPFFRIWGKFTLSAEPRLRSRPKFLSDKTFQTEIISDQTFQAEIHPDQSFQNQNTSDQTFQTQKVSDQTFQTEVVLIRPSTEHGPDSNSDHCPDLNQTMIRLKCTRRGYNQTQLRSKQLWSDPVALAAIHNQTEVRSKPVLIRLNCARNSLIRDKFYI